MNLEKEFRDLKKTWNNTSLLGKIFLAVGFFMTVGSVASLADTVYNWKGFILDGLAFYQEWIQKPIKLLANFINIKLSEDYVDMIVVDVICIVAIIRNMYHENETKKEIKERFKFFGLWFNSLSFTIFMVISIGLLGVLLNFILIAYVKVIPSSIVMLITSSIYIGGVIFFNYKIDVLNGREAKNRAIITAMPLILPIITVLILGAINSGLTR